MPLYPITPPQWADAVLNYLCAHGSFRDAGLPSLLLTTLPSLAAGLTPWVDQFMHLGGAACGACLTTLLLPQFTPPPPKVYELRQGGASGAGRQASSCRGASLTSPLAATSPLRRRSSMTLHLPPARQAQQYGSALGGGPDADASLEMVAPDLRTPSPRDVQRLEEQSQPFRRSTSTRQCAMAAVTAVAAMASSPEATAAAAAGRRAGRLAGPRAKAQAPTSSCVCRLMRGLRYDRLNSAQRAVVGLSAACLLGMLGASLSALSSEVHGLLRSCTACKVRPSLPHTRPARSGTLLCNPCALRRRHTRVSFPSFSYSRRQL